MGTEYTIAYWGVLLVLTPGLLYIALEIANSAMVVMGKVKLMAIVGLAETAI